MQHIQVGPVVNKDTDPNTEFYLEGNEICPAPTSRHTVCPRRNCSLCRRQKLNADNNGRGNANEFKVDSLVLLVTQNLAKHTVSDFVARKLAPRSIGPFTVLAKHGNAYTLNIPFSMCLHPTVYVGRLKPYSQHE
ncbi:unnamed protein product [Phytophthora fragariaefolia]|uniref:Unnamed protein product n=1 Tax=Phytophthora fragariaefolia TaxID=1490495 RepID=A0A9W7D5B1_9STRA|nr:unnamed protein product [Phytophthora fragariaefolia]